MEKIIERFQKYVATYKPEHACGMESVFIKDMLYGIGRSIDDKYSWATGFDLWKKELQKYVKGDK